MLSPLTTPYADTQASDLSWTLGLDRMDALAVLPLDLDHLLGRTARSDAGPRSGRSGRSGRLELRLLGASHQVLLELAGRKLSETVACLPDRAGSMPSGVRQQVHGLAYDFSSSTSRSLSDADFSAQVAALRETYEGHPRALVGFFPGAADAVTALVAEVVEGGIGWRTWHAYPQTGELVATRTLVESS